MPRGAPSLSKPDAQPPASGVHSMDTSYLESLLGYNARRAALVTIEKFIERMRPFDLRPVEFSVLSVLRHNPGATSRQVCAALGIQPPNFVPLLASLEKRNWITRTPHLRDRRAISLHLSEAGQTMMTSAEAVATELEADIISALKATEQRQILALLRKIYLAQAPAI